MKGSSRPERLLRPVIRAGAWLLALIRDEAERQELDRRGHFRCVRCTYVHIKGTDPCGDYERKRGTQ